MTDSASSAVIDTSTATDPDTNLSIFELKEQAITAALSHNWTEAVRINTKIIQHNKGDIDALNRLGFAYGKLGNMNEAKKAFLHVKSLDPYNQIAIKNLGKLSPLSSQELSSNRKTTILSPLIFIEDPGKTKVVQCVNVAPAQIISTIHCGEQVYLKPKNYCIEIRDEKQHYLAALPDDLSFRLIKLLAAKNMYSVVVKSVDKNNLTVFIRETARGSKFKNQPSFINVPSYQSYSKQESVAESEKPDTTPTGEEEENSNPAGSS